MIGRPQPTEFANVYAAYINQITGVNPGIIIETQLADALQFLSTISEEKSLRRYAPQKWSVREVLNHVTDTERAFAFRALWFARGFSEPLPGYDQNIGAAGAAADRISWADHMDDFRSVRLATISLYKNLSPDAWLRTGIASGNPFTVRALGFIIPGHVAHHLALLRDRYLTPLSPG
jgi:hypothetical protein